MNCKIFFLWLTFFVLTFLPYTLFMDSVSLHCEKGFLCIFLSALGIKKVVAKKVRTRNSMQKRKRNLLFIII